MADQGPLVRVDTGGGNLIKMTAKDAETYRAAHPEVSAPEVSAPAVEPEVDGDKSLGDHTVAELREIAEDKGIDLGGATKKADILAAIEGDGEEEQE